MNPSIEQIIKANALSMSQVEITFDGRFPTVSIVDCSGDGQDEIFLQGHEAEEFAHQIAEVWALNPDLTEDEIIKHLAVPFVEMWQ